MLISVLLRGGVSNVLDSTTWSAIGGGLNNQILTANYSTICGGRDNVITNNDCVLAGEGLTTAFDGQTAVGSYNNPAGTIGGSPRVFMVGGGANNNLFSVTADGIAHAAVTFASPGADYAEYFESDADVVDAVVPGTSVVINPDTGNVRPALPGATLLLGVVRPKRAAMSVVGNTANDYWHDKYLVDEMGQPVYTGTVEYIPAPTGPVSAPMGPVLLQLKTPPPLPPPPARSYRHVCVPHRAHAQPRLRSIDAVRAPHCAP